MNIKIIPAEATDVGVLVAIQKQAFKRLYDIYNDEGSPYLRGEDEILTWLERSNWHVNKILVDDVLCGGVSFCEKNGQPGVYYLARIYILPEMQGKGIASTAVLLCEDTVVNASCWTLDYPADQIANRKCYEKAGYINTGKKCEQSGGAITLAYMEKSLPVFRDVKNHLNNPDIIKLISYSEYENSLVRAAQKALSYKYNLEQQLYAWVESGKIIGICGFLVYSDKVEITNIAVVESTRGTGIGRSMITALQDKYSRNIEAETDDDAVDFYRKCGFVATAIYKQYGSEQIRRWICKSSTDRKVDHK